MTNAAVPSPCVDVCRMDAKTGWCEGCQRTLREIGAWSSLDDDDKRAIWALLPLRRARLEPSPSPKQSPTPSPKPDALP